MTTEKGGKPAYVPTPGSRSQVAAMAGYGLDARKIAAVLGVSHNTIRRHYRNELAAATDRANIQVVQALFKKAIGGSVEAQKFWLKCRADWREAPSRLEHSGPLGGPIAVETRQIDYSKFSYDALVELEAIIEGASSEDVAALSDREDQGTTG